MCNWAKLLVANANYVAIRWKMWNMKRIKKTSENQIYYAIQNVWTEENLNGTLKYLEIDRTRENMSLLMNKKNMSTYTRVKYGVMVAITPSTKGNAYNEVHINNSLSSYLKLCEFEFLGNYHLKRSKSPQRLLLYANDGGI